MSKKQSHHKKRPRVPRTSNVHVPGTRKRPMAEHRKVCLVVGDTAAPIVSVIRRDQTQGAHDSGFTVITAEAPDSPDDATDDDYTTECLACLARTHPEAERGLILARAYGHAWWDDREGCWLAEDSDGNEVLFESGDEPGEGPPPA